jgi:hypothetical protein
MPTFAEHERQYFNRLRGINPADPANETDYFETRALMDVVYHVANKRDPDDRFEVFLVAAGITDQYWSGFFKVDTMPGLVFEVSYDRRNETSTFETFKTCPTNKAIRTATSRRRAQVDEEIQLIKRSW